MKEKCDNLNHNLKEDDFFKSKENLTNFLDDSYRVPHLRNCLYTKTQGKENLTNIYDKIDYIKSPNSIPEQTLNYLKNIKRNYQHEKDKLEEGYRKNEKNSEFLMKMEETYKNLYTQFNEDLMSVKKFDYNDYFKYKYEKYSSVQFTDNKVKDIIKKVMENKTKKIFGRIFGNLINEKFKLKARLSQIEDMVNKEFSV
jgi:hypothetical protein